MLLSPICARAGTNIVHVPGSRPGQLQPLRQPRCAGRIFGQQDPTQEVSCDVLTILCAHYIIMCSLYYVLTTSLCAHYIMCSLHHYVLRYKQLALKYHPDKTRGCPDSAEIFKAVANAWALLDDKDQYLEWSLTDAGKLYVAWRRNKHGPCPRQADVHKYVLNHYVLINHMCSSTICAQPHVLTLASCFVQRHGSCSCRIRRHRSNRGL